MTIPFASPRRPAAIAALLLLGLTGCAQTPIVDPMPDRDRALDPVSFLEGSWQTGGDAPDFTEEHWTKASGGQMLGMARTLARSPDGNLQIAFYEFLRIERRPDGTIVYLASPNGRTPPTPFRLVKQSQREAIFENPEHDFPTRIIYRVDPENPDSLTARIEGTRNGHADAEAWRFVRQPR